LERGFGPISAKIKAHDEKAAACEGRRRGLSAQMRRHR